MQFAILDHERKKPGGYRPILPAGFQLAREQPYLQPLPERPWVYQFPPWGIYRVLQYGDGEVGYVDEALDSALYSALDYPPALAVAAEYLRIKFPSGAEVSDFCETALKALHFYLGDQIHSPFFVARAATDGDEIRAGDFRWIVAVSNLRDQVLWVSYQSILEEADFETFGLSRDFLEKRFAGRRLFDFDPSVYEERSSPRSGTS